MKRPLTRAEILRSIEQRVTAMLDMLDACHVAGNVVVEIHRDNGGVRKVRVSHEETWDCTTALPTQQP